MAENVPIVDFANCGLGTIEDEDVKEDALKAAGENLYEAFTSSGFAYLSNHGITTDEILGFRDMMDKFFALPDETKIKHCSKNLSFCYDPIGALKVSPNREHDYQEAFRMTGNGLADSSTVWPDDPAEFKDTSLKFADTCKRLALRLMKALGAGMRLKDSLYLWKCHQLLNQIGNSTMLKAIRYPPLLSKDTLRENQLRLGEHTDWTCLTLLFQDVNGGLQVENFKGEFEDVPPIPGTIVLNVGDLLQFWSGGRLKSSVHRVVAPSDSQKQRNIRRSVVYFISADDHVPLSEMEFESGAEGAKIQANEQKKNCTVKEYKDKRYKDMFY